MSFSAGRPVSHGAAIKSTNQWSETNAIFRHFGKAFSSLKAAILVTLMAATPAAAQYTLVGTPQDFANSPITDLMEARNPRTCNPASGNSATGTFDPYDAGTYRLLPQTGNLLNWQPPSGNDDGTAPAGVIKPSGNYMVINAFADVGAHCYDINDDLNGNGRRAELACVSFPNVPVGNYAATSFFAEATNTDPSTTSYNFRVRHSGGTVLTQDVTNLAAGDRNWQYNETRFNVTAQNTVEICLIQDSNLDFGADIHLDQIALYATCNGTNNSVVCPAPSLRLEKRADPSGISAQPAVNDTVSYTYIVTNTGNRTLFNVAVSESTGGFSGTGTLPSPAYVSGGSNEDGGAGTLDLVQGATMTFSASYAITAADIAAGVLENSATASGTAPLGNVVYDTSDTGTNRSGGSIANAETVETADASGATDGDTTNDPTVIDIVSPPIARNDSATGFDTNTAAQIDPLADNGNGADSDPDGTLDATSLLLTGTGAPAGSSLAPNGKTLTVPGEGVWTVNATTGIVTFTPAAGFTADPTPVTYTVADNDGNASNEATITLGFLTQSPTAQDDLVANLPTNTPATVNPLVNNGNGADSDPDGTLDATSVVLTGTGVSPDGKTLAVPGQGVWTVNATSGVVTFTPEPGFTADPTPVTYTVADNDGNVSNEATITLDYIAQDPTARDDQLTGLTSGSPAMINPLADNGNGADSDPDGSLDSTTVLLTGTGVSPDGKTLTVPGEGVWTVNPTTGAVTFTPETGFTADPTPVTYTVDDNDGNTSNPATITLDYPQTAPVAVDDTAVGVPGQVARVNVLGNDTDAEADIDPTTVALTDPAATDTNADGIPDRLVVAGEGVWTVDPVTGEVSFTPDPAFAGDPTPIRYQVSDTTGLVSNTALITIDYPVTGTGISGIAYTDRDASGTYDSGTDVLMPGVIVELRNPGGVLIAQGVTDANGAYSLSDFAVGDDFTLSFIEAGTGDVLDTITDLDFAPNTVMTNQDGLVVPAVPVGALSLAKTALVRDVQIGGTAPFDITLTNSTAVQVGPVTVIDNLPAGLIYQPDSAMLDGVPVTPVVEGRQVRLEGVMVPPNGTATLRLITRVTSAAAMGEIVNRASVIDPDTGLQATGDATASIYLRPEAVFHCTDVIGKVFDDRNMDGYQNAPVPEISISTRGMVQNYDAPLGGKADGAAQVAELTGEPGLANVRLVTPTGTIITTDAHGRFSVPCAELPAAIGTNFALKLDTRSLPTGYRVTTENPLVMRLTAGIMAEMNFGAALGRVATVDLTASAFTPGAASPSPRLEQGLQGLLTQIAETPTVLRLSYFTGSDDTALAAARLDAVEQIINDAWADIGSYRLQIERTTKQLQ